MFLNIFSYLIICSLDLFCQKKEKEKIESTYNVSTIIIIFHFQTKILVKGSNLNILFNNRDFIN